MYKNIVVDQMWAPRKERSVAREGNITQTRFLSPVQDFPSESAAAAVVKQADLQANTIAYICTMYITVDRLMTHY